MQEDRLSTAIYYFCYIVFGEFCLTFHYDLITLNGNNLTGILVNEIFIPALENTRSQLASYRCLHVLLVHLNLLGKVEYLKNILILLISYRTEKSCYRQLLLTVDISIHHIVDICSEFYP